MVAQPKSEFDLPQLGLVQDPYKLDQNVRVLRFEEAHEAFTQGFWWGLVVITLGFWIPVVSAAYAWLA